jgi:hypothetical protein
MYVMLLKIYFDLKPCNHVSHGRLISVLGFCCFLFYFGARYDNVFAKFVFEEFHRKHYEHQYPNLWVVNDRINQKCSAGTVQISRVIMLDDFSLWG